MARLARLCGRCSRPVTPYAGAYLILMSHHNLPLDVHDRAHVRDITHVRYERPWGKGEQVRREKSVISAGDLLRRLVYHLDRFQVQLLPVLVVPPIVGETQGLCVDIGPVDRQLWRSLAERRGWKFPSLARALIQWHWKLRKQFQKASPQDYASQLRLGRYLSFDPDRLQPWYYHEDELSKKVDQWSKDIEQANLITLLRRQKGKVIDEDLIALMVKDLDRAGTFRDAYVWNSPYMSPEELRKREYRSEGGQL